MPPLVRTATITACFRSLFLGGSRGSGLGDKNYVSRATEHLAFSIAEKAFGPYIPACCDAIRIQSKDRKIDGAFNKQLKQLLLIRL
jgi:hypothetical protein